MANGSRFEVDEDALPFDKRLAACIVGAVYLDVLADPLQVVPLQVEGGGAFAVGEANGLTQGRIVADPPDGLYRVGEQHRVPDGPGLDSGEHQRGDPQLQKRLNLAEVGVTDDHVESAVPRRIGMGLIPGVDDRALQRGFETDLFFEEVGTLGDLEVDRGPAVLTSHLAGTGEDLTRYEEPREMPDEVAERHGSRHQVVLVRSV